MGTQLRSENVWSKQINFSFFVWGIAYMFSTLVRMLLIIYCCYEFKYLVYLFNCYICCGVILSGYFTKQFAAKIALPVSLTCIEDPCGCGFPSKYLHTRYEIVCLCCSEVGTVCSELIPHTIEKSITQRHCIIYGICQRGILVEASTCQLGYLSCKLNILEINISYFSVRNENLYVCIIIGPA